MRNQKKSVIWVLGPGYNQMEQVETGWSKVLFSPFSVPVSGAGPHSVQAACLYHVLYHLAKFLVFPYQNPKGVLIEFWNFLIKNRSQIGHKSGFKIVANFH